MGSIIADVGAAMGATATANQQRYQSRVQAGISGQNAAIAGAQKERTEAVANQQAGLVEMKGSQLASTQKADYAASGVTVGSGTPSMVMLDTKAMADLDAATIKNNAARQAWGYEIQKTNQENQAALDIYGGTQAVEATMLSTGFKVGQDNVNSAASTFAGMGGGGGGGTAGTGSAGHW